MVSVRKTVTKVGAAWQSQDEVKGKDKAFKYRVGVQKAKERKEFTCAMVASVPKKMSRNQSSSFAPLWCKMHEISSRKRAQPKVYQKAILW